MGALSYLGASALPAAAVVLFFADLHLGRLDAATERANEEDFVACLRAYEGRVAHLFLVGDVFHQYIEYRHLAPKGFARLLGLLAAWTDAGVPVTYVVGNHDPWHRDYFAAELGVRVVADTALEPLHGHVVYLAHGDRFAPRSHLSTRLRPWLRHPVPVWLYRTLLPGDAGFGLARWVSRRWSDRAPDAATAQALRQAARHLLSTTPADFIVMGHSHVPELTAWPEGRYLNPGCWHTDRTFGCLDADGTAALLTWNGSCVVPYAPPASSGRPSR